MTSNVSEVARVVSNHSKFHKHEPKQYSHLFTRIQEIAPTLPVPVIITPNKLYGVLNSDLNCWFRATVGKICGIFQEEKGQADELLYQCFLVDVGHHEQIKKSNIRVLPNDLMGLRPFTKERIIPHNRVDTDEPALTAMPLIENVASPKDRLGVESIYTDASGADAMIPTISSSKSPSSSHRPLKEFKPKFGSWELDSKPIEHAAVRITEMTSPSYVYLQIEDEDIYHYHRMAKELDEEFRFANIHSETYCPSPVVGGAYAALLGDHWCRVLVETTDSGIKILFCVDSGRRSMIKPDMMIHELRDRFLKLPAQGIRCYLKGVFPPINSDGTAELDFPDKIYDYLRRFVNKQAVAFVSEWQAGQVGCLDSSDGSLAVELNAIVTLYPNDEPNSINLQVGRSSYAHLRGPSLQLPEHFRIRRILEQNRRSKRTIPATPLPLENLNSNMDALEDSSTDSDSSIGSFNDDSCLTLSLPMKFKPKFIRSELQSKPLKYAKVFITKALQPRSIYVQIEDDDTPLYHQMHEDLQLEFQSANSQSASYCSSPVVGYPYVYRYGTQWHRVLIEKPNRRVLEVFFVDLGLRLAIHPSMMFYKIPDRFMKLRAQAVRCSLMAVYPPKYPAALDDRFPSEIFQMMPTKYDEKKAIAFFDDWLVGEVGKVGFDPQDPRELVAITVLYLDDESESINHQIGKSSLASFILNRREGIPPHSVILEKLAAKKSQSEVVLNDQKKEESNFDGSSTTSDSVYESAESDLENDLVPVCLPRKLSATEERNRFFDILQEVAPTCPSIPDSLITDQVYIVLTSFRKWHRATIGSSCGTHQVGDGPSEALYRCFLLDVAVDDRVPKSSIRVLPQDLMEHPPFAPKRVTSSETNINASSLIISVSPEIQITPDVPANTIKTKDNQNHVESIGSIISHSVESLEAHIIKKYKPKFSRLDLKFSPIHYASVIISKALHPRAVYVRIDDDEVPLFRRMMNELQQEFQSATPGSDSFCSSPLIGHAYTALYGDQWCRVLIEKVNNTAEVFFVDIGHRQTIHPSMMFFNLPVKFLELPAQAVRCSLRGVSPPMNAKNGLFPPGIFNYMSSRFNGKEAAVFFYLWQEGQVGNQGDSSNSRELVAYSVLYLNETVRRRSINTEICRTSMARQTLKKIDRSIHSDIRRRLSTLPAHMLQCSLVEGLRYPSTIPDESGSSPSEVSIVNENQQEEEVALTRKIEEEFNLPVIFVGCQSPYSLFFRTPELVKKFLRLQSGLQTYFHAEKGVATKEMVYLEIGFIGAVYHEESWFRAEVIGVDGYPEIMVSLLDTSCIKYVNASEVRRLPGGLDQIPRTVLHCSLSGIHPPSSSGWDVEVNQCIINRLEGEDRIIIGCQKNLKESVGEILPVTVYLPRQVVGEMMHTNLNKELVFHGLASTDATPNID